MPGLQSLVSTWTKINAPPGQQQHQHQGQSPNGDPHTVASGADPIPGAAAGGERVGGVAVVGPPTTTRTTIGDDVADNSNSSRPHTPPHQLPHLASLASASSSLSSYSFAANNGNKMVGMMLPPPPPPPPPLLVPYMNNNTNDNGSNSIILPGGSRDGVGAVGLNDIQRRSQQIQNVNNNAANVGPADANVTIAAPFLYRGGVMGNQQRQYHPTVQPQLSTSQYGLQYGIRGTTTTLGLGGHRGANNALVDATGFLSAANHRQSSATSTSSSSNNRNNINNFNSNHNNNESIDSCIPPSKAGADAILGRRSSSSNDGDFTALTTAMNAPAEAAPRNAHAESMREKQRQYSLSSSTSSSSSQLKRSPATSLWHSERRANGNLLAFTQKQKNTSHGVIPSSSMMLMMMRQQQEEQEQREQREQQEREHEKQRRNSHNSLSSSSSTKNVSSGGGDLLKHPSSSISMPQKQAQRHHTQLPHMQRMHPQQMRQQMHPPQ